MDELDHLGWVVYRSYEIAGVELGIRTNSYAVAEWLDDVLGRYRVDEDADPYYSILVPEDSRGVGRRFNLLYRESTSIARGFDLAPLARTLLAELEAVDFAGRDDGLYLACGLLRRHGRTIVVPSLLVPYLGTLGSRVERSGIELPVELSTVVDLESGLAIPVPHRLDVPADAVERLTGPVSGGESRWQLDGPTRIDGVVSTGLGGDAIEPVSAGRAAYRLGFYAANLERLMDRGVEALMGLSAGASTLELRTGNPREALDGLVAAFDLLESG
jgi:hypothetical protein